MKTIRHCMLAAWLASATLTAGAQSVQPLTVGGGWVEFDVDELLSAPGNPLGWIALDGSSVSFSFTLTASAELRVVDAGFAGDEFVVGGQSQSGSFGFNTSSVAVYEAASAPNIGTDFDAAWGDNRFSRGSIVLGPGSYSVTGRLDQSVLLDGLPLNATVGAIALTPVPEPGSVATLLTGLLLIASVLRGRGGRP